MPSNYMYNTIKQDRSVILAFWVSSSLSTDNYPLSCLLLTTTLQEENDVDLVEQS